MNFKRKRSHRQIRCSSCNSSSQRWLGNSTKNDHRSKREQSLREVAKREINETTI